MPTAKTAKTKKQARKESTMPAAVKTKKAVQPYARKSLTRARARALDAQLGAIEAGLDRLGKRLGRLLA